MKFPIGKIASVGARVLGAIIQSVPVVQAASAAFKAGTGAEKKEAVLDVVRAELSAAAMVTGHDWSKDAEVIDAAGVINDAIVAFHKLLARKASVPAPQ